MQNIEEYIREKLVDKMHDANIVLLIVTIRGLAIHGYNKNALKLFDLMKHFKTNPNNITF